MAGNVYDVEDGFAIKGLEPPGLRKQSDDVRRMFWGWALEAALRQKDRDLSMGLDKDGNPMRAISAATRKHRHSEMTPSGEGDPSAPPLEPGRRLSRVRSLLTGRAEIDHIELWWKFDPFTGDSFARILEKQRDQGRDVFGLSPAAIKRVMAYAWDRFKRWGAGKPVELPRPIGVAQARAIVTAGSTDTRYATFGIGRAAPPAQWSGGMRAEDWRAHFRQTAAATIPGRPAGPYNRILGHIWGQQGPPGGTIQPPKPKPKPKPLAPAAAPTPSPSPPPPPPPPRTFEEALRAATAGLTTLDAIKAAVRDTINAMATKGPSGDFHGMTDAEDFRTIAFWGLDWHFTDRTGPSLFKSIYDIAIRSITGPGGVDLAAGRKHYPGRLTAATRAVYFTHQANKNDDYWKRVYANFTGSAATGGDGEVVIYGGRAATDYILAHEMGHNLAARIYGSAAPSADYSKAIAGAAEPPVSAYATNAPSEDFAESVRLYVQDIDKMKGDHPIRYAVIHRIMTDPSYGG